MNNLQQMIERTLELVEVANEVAHRAKTAEQAREKQSSELQVKIASCVDQLVAGGMVSAAKRENALTKLASHEHTLDTLLALSTKYQELLAKTAESQTPPVGQAVKTAGQDSQSVGVGHPLGQKTSAVRPSDRLWLERAGLSPSN